MAGSIRGRRAAECPNCVDFKYRSRRLDRPPSPSRGHGSFVACRTNATVRELRLSPKRQLHWDTSLLCVSLGHLTTSRPFKISLTVSKLDTTSQSEFNLSRDGRPETFRLPPYCKEERCSERDEQQDVVILSFWQYSAQKENVARNGSLWHNIRGTMFAVPLIGN